MRSLFSRCVLSNGSLLIINRLPLNLLEANTILINDSINHPLWSGLVGEPKTEVSKFINKFNVKKIIKD